MPTPAAPPSPAPTGAELDALTDRASELARGLAASTERERALPQALVDELRATGLMRAGAPAALGALEGSPATILSAAERIARGDASAGWCVSIAATSSLLSAYLPDRGAREIFGDPSTIAAGVWAPRGRAVVADGGLRVSGRWSFCSGISHSEWLFAGCVLDDRQAGAEGPILRVAALPTAELEILDTWHTSGLRGTGSHDALADDLLVPDHRVLSLLDAGPRIDAPLYRFPIFGFFALSIAAAALGNARGAIDDLSELAAGKTAQGSSRSSGRASRHAGSRRRGRGCPAGCAGPLLRGHRGGMGRRPTGRAARGVTAPRTTSRGDPCGQDLRRGGPFDVRPRWRDGDL